MQVVLDANVVVSEGYGSSTLFQFLLSESEAVGHRICLPAPAMDEVVASFAKMLEGETRKVDKSLEILSKRVARILSSPIVNFDHEREAVIFRDWLKAKCAILSYPNTPHKELVSRAIARRKPFDEKGSGYRDTLIWESVLELASEVYDRVVLLSYDKDFCGEDKGLHPDLVNELVGREHSKEKVVLVRSTSDFIDAYIRPILKVFEDSSGQTSNELGRDLKDTIGLSIQDAYAGEEWYPEQLGIAWEYETLHLVMVEDIPDLSIVDLREASDGRMLLRIKATLECEFDAFVFKPDMYGMDDIRVHDYNWNDHYVLAGLSLTLRCELDLLLSASEQPSVEVLSMEPLPDSG